MSNNEHVTAKSSFQRFGPDKREEWRIEWDGVRLTVGMGEWGPAVIDPARVPALISDIQSVLATVSK